MAKKEDKVEEKDFHVEVKTGLSAEVKQKPKHQAKLGDIFYYYKLENLQSGGTKLKPSVALVIGLVGSDQNMKAEDHAINCKVWGKLGYEENKFNVRYSETPTAGLWSKVLIED